MTDNQGTKTAKDSRREAPLFRGLRIRDALRTYRDRCVGGSGQRRAHVQDLPPVGFDAGR